MIMPLRLISPCDKSAPLKKHTRTPVRRSSSTHPESLQTESIICPFYNHFIHPRLGDDDNAHEALQLLQYDLIISIISIIVLYLYHFIIILYPRLEEHENAHEALELLGRELLHRLRRLLQLRRVLDAHLRIIHGYN